MKEIKLPHSKKPNHSRLMPYNRRQAQMGLALMVMDYFSNDNHQLVHPLTFCSGIEICFYAKPDCLYGKKGCYYE